jgi:hypothetical protein
MAWASACRPPLALVAAAAVCTGLLVGIAPARTAYAHPEVCATDGKDEPGHDHGERQEICFTQEEIDAMDDSAATLGVDEITHSPNLRPIANIPKQAPFDSETSLATDWAFKGHYAYQGNYNGISVYDIANPAAPRLVANVSCPGSQNDVSVYRDLLITSTDSSRNKPECEGNLPQSATIKESWEGLRIFDISNPAQPRYVTAVETDCGSHTHTTIPDFWHHRALVYVQSYGPAAAYPDCQPPHDKISIVEIPARAPQQARVVAEPVLFPDGGFPGVPGRTSSTSGCHDITAYPAIKLAAGACMGQGVLLDISDPVRPRVLDSVTDPNFAFWHSATFNNRGTSVVFTDELGGGGGPTCNPTVGPDRGADGIYRIVRTPQGPKLRFASYYKIPRVNYNTENCVAHNGSLIPTLGRDVMVQAWYQGGVSVFDFTDPARPRELAWFERGPLSMDRLIVGGSWSAYWYNGRIYSSDIQKGLDVLKLTGRAVVGTGINRVPYLNAQTQVPYLG